MQNPSIDTLLRHDAWLRALAARLVADPALADDAVQQTWITALQHPPRHGSNPRGWLAEVLRNAVRTGRRSAKRRDAAERSVTPPNAADPTIDLVARVQQQRELSGLVLELDEAQRAVVLMRFFEDLPPRRIAERLEIPVETVRTRLKRALASLRRRLDEERGGRDAWVAAAFAVYSGDAVFASVLRTAVGGASGSAATTSVVRWFEREGWKLLKPTTKLTLTAAAVIAVGITTALLLQEKDEEPAPIDRMASESSDGKPQRSGDRAVSLVGELDAGRRAVVAPSGAKNARAPSAQATSDRVLRGRVVTVDGQPLGAVRLHWAGPLRLRWSDSIDPWINSAGGSMKVTPETHARLREDPEFASQVFGRFEDPAEWRAFLLGEVQEGRGVPTAADGTFELALLGEAPADGRIAIVEPGYTLVGRGEVRDGEGQIVEHVLVAARAVDVGGVVEDPLSQAVGDTLVSVGLGRAPFPDLGSDVDWRATEPPTFRTGANGRYLLRGVPVVAGAQVDGVHESRGRASVVAPEQPTNDLTLTLDRVADVPAVAAVSGVVLSAEGRPIAGARLMFGSAQEVADENGRFAMELPTDADQLSLFAVAKGHRAVTVAGFGKRLRALASNPEPVEVRLGPAPIAITGRLVDPAGAPVANASINLFDPSLPDTTFSSLEMMSEGRRNVRSDESGQFRIGGLSERTYRLRIWRLDGMLVHISEPVQAGAGQVEIVVPSSDAAPAQGRVVDLTGRPIAGAEVRIGFTTFQPRRGWLGELTPAVKADETGAFSLAAVPRRHVFLQVAAGDEVQPKRFTVDEFADLSFVELRVPRDRAVTFVAPGDRSGQSLGFVDVNDRVVEFGVQRGGSDRVTRAVWHPTLGFPACRVPETATALLVFRGEVVIGRQAVRLDAPEVELTVR